MDVKTFHWADYVVLVFVLISSVAIGIYHVIKSRKVDRNKTQEFLLAGKQMSMFSMSISIFVTSLTANAMLANPVEVYSHGVVYVYCLIGHLLAYPTIAYVFVPFYYNLKITSVYEFLEKRYSQALRYITVVIMLICTSLYMGIVLYGPSVALSQVTGIEGWISIIIIGSIGTLYAALGGMKAVMWVDIFQGVIMLAGMTTLLIRGTYLAGGVSNVWDTASQHGRINPIKLSLNPLVRSTVWSYAANTFFLTLTGIIGSQPIIQRFFSMSSAQDASRALMLNLPMMTMSVLLNASIGLVMFTFYEGCDPLLDGRIVSRNQLIPLFVMDVLGILPGVPGLFLACLFSAALSTLSSAINGIGAVGLIDFAIPVYRKCSGKLPSDSTSLLIAKVTSVIFGLVVMGLAFITSTADVELYSVSRVIGGIFMGPIGAVFFMGRLIPFVDAISAGCGVMMAVFMSLWWVFGQMSHTSPSQALMVSSAACLSENTSAYIILHEESITSSVLSVTLEANSTVSDLNEQGITFDSIFGISPLWFFPFGFCTSVLISVITAGIKRGIKMVLCRTESQQTYHMASLDEKN